MLHKCIADSQSTFVPCKSILDNVLVFFFFFTKDNVLVAIKLVPYMKTKKSGNEKSVALKLDISKTYDMID